MDIFKFTNPNEPTKMEQGELINGIRTKMWIERYFEAGEFTFTAPVSSGLRRTLPIGTFISHIGTKEIMLVENHEINYNEDAEDEIVISGRGFETFFEQRIVGSNRVFPRVGDLTEYTIAANYSWLQAIQMVNDHIVTDNLVNDDYALDYISTISNVTIESVEIERAIPRGNLYDRLLELLAVDFLGIKVVRPGPWSPFGPDSPHVALVIHQGVDRSSEVIFSYDTGEIVSADYLWTNKALKNAVLVKGTWVETVVNPSGMTGIQRRMMYVDASDIDSSLDEPPLPGSPTYLSILAYLQRRGLEALFQQNDVALTKAEVSRNAAGSKYRQDFDVGDLITVSGDYNEVSTMRVMEYVEIEDDTGESGYPTLSLLEPEVFNTLEDPLVFPDPDPDPDPGPGDPPDPPISEILEDSMLFKRGSVTFPGSPSSDSPQATINFATPFPSNSYQIFLTEAVATNSDPIDEIDPGFIRTSNQSPNGFKIFRTAPTHVETDHAVRIEWWAVLTDNAEGEIAEL